MLKIIVSLFLFILSAQAFSLTAAENLQALLSPIKTMQADFKQTTTAKTAEFIVTAEGLAKIERPGKFYWQVDKPGKQIIIINDGTLWLYDVDLQQVTIKKMTANAVALNPASLLSGTLAELLKNNIVEQNADTFTLKPKTNSGSTKWIKILFTGKMLTGLQFENQLEQLTTIEFTHIMINQPISDRVFNLKIPKGTDIVKE